MSKKLSVDLELNAQGFKQGMNEAKNSTAAYTNAVRDVKKETENYINSCGSLSKQLRAATKEAENLAIQFNDLSAAEKQSEFGQDLAESLQMAIERSAELKDVMKDTRDAIRISSSDTATWDAMKESLDVAKNLTMAYAGAIAKLTGDEKALKNAVASIAMVQGGFNAVIKAGNMLQKNSATMIALQRAGVLSLTQAEQISTIATKAQTAALQGLSSAMKMVPYLAAAAGIAAITVAIVKYISKSDDAAEATAKFKEELHNASIEGQKDAMDEVSKLDTLYARSQDMTLSYEQRKKAVDDMQALYPTYLGNLSDEEILAGKASAAYQQLRDDIIAVAMARAYEEKIAEKAKEAVDIKDQIKQQKELVKAREQQIKDAKSANTGQTFGTANVDMGSMNVRQSENALKKDKKKLDELNESLQQNNDQIIEYQKNINETLPAQERLADNANKVKENNKGGGHTAPKKDDPTKTRLENLTDAVNKAKKALEDLDETDPDFPDIKEAALKNLKDAEQALKDYKIAVGIETPKSQLDQWKDELKQAQAELPFAVSDEDVQKIWNTIQELKDKIEGENVRLHLTVEPEQNNKGVEEIKKIMEEPLTKEKPKYDFKFLPDGSKIKEEFDGVKEQYDALIDKRTRLEKIMNTPGVGDQTIHDAQKAIDEVNSQIEQSEDKLDSFKSANDKYEQYNNIAKGAKQAGDAIGTLGSAFSALGDATNDPGLKAMGIIATTLANLALSFSEAMVQAGSMGPWGWLAFGIAGMTQLAAMIAQIKSLTAGSYAEGGIIPGNSFNGDKLLANVNSREMILNTRQQKNLFDMANGKGLAYRDNSNLTVSSIRVQGRSLLLCLNNELKATKKQPIT